jgi:hypothetical protein
VKPNAMLAAYFAGSCLLTVASVLLLFEFLPTDETVTKYFFGLLSVFWAIMAVFFGLDLFKGDHVVIRARVADVRHNRVWLQWETGRKMSIVIRDPDLLKKLAPHKQVELLLTKRMKQFKGLRL